MAHLEANPEVIAHRGHRNAFPENTLAAIGDALVCGARFVEVDVHLTADRTPVLLHDESLVRVCGVDGLIHHVPDRALQTLRAFEPGRLGRTFANEPLARLDACRSLMAGHPEARFFIELKEAAAREFGEATVVERVVGELEPVLDRCVMISFSETLLLEAQRQAGCAVGPVVRAWKERGVVDRLDRRPEFMFCDIRGLPRGGTLAVEGVNLAVYEVPDAGTAMALHERGVGYVETFGVCAMLRDLRAQR
jgi:glycerophosphoryl diester phosphodiesterase